MRKLFLLSALSALAFCSCTKEMWTLQQEQATDSLLATYYSPLLFRGCDDSGNIAIFSFSDGSSIEIDRNSTAVFSASDGVFPSVTSHNGKWKINGISTGIPLTESLGNLKSKLVCMAYDCNALYIYMSNGKTLHIPSTIEGSLWAFSFNKEDNPQLASTLHCDISGFTISGMLERGDFSNKMCPDISYRGKSISVNGEPQRNRRSRQSFAGTVEYVLTLFDDSKLTYKVKLSEAYPSIWLYTEGGKEIEKGTYTTGSIRISDPLKCYWDKEEFKTQIQIRGRGNSTWHNFPKKPYRIKLQEKEAIFGMPANRDWALLANYSDKSLLRNQLAMKVSEICGMSWTPKIFNVDVFLNDEYIGSYDFTEHKEVSKHRVNINTSVGDCYLEIEAKKDKPVCFDTRMKIPIMFSAPEQPSAALKEEIIRYFSDFETALSSPYFSDPIKGYRSFVDIDSFINNYIIQELSKNIDADLFKSLFLVKRKEGKLEFYHVWDFDLAFGNCNYLNAHEAVPTGPEGWYIRNHTQEGINTGWYYLMFKDPWFEAQLKEKWMTVYPQLKTIPEEIRCLSHQIFGSAGRNFSRWQILDSYVWPNVVWLGSYDKEVDYLLDFYSRRLEWMNNQILSASGTPLPKN